MATFKISLFHFTLLKLTLSSEKLKMKKVVHLNALFLQKKGEEFRLKNASNLTHEFLYKNY